MYRLSLLINCLLLLALGLQAQNPHGKEFRMDCAECHSSGSWSYNSKLKFRHEKTGFTLEGQHKNIDCKACHTNLNFKKTSSSCISCHSDMHNQTVGNDCARCHNSQSWIIENIAKIHDKTSFPLVGVHKTVNCDQCHKTSTKLEFSPLGQTCIECHKSDFDLAKSPNHTKLNLSNNCAFCHNTTVQDWKTRTFPDHNAVYPLTGAHASIAQECEKCHIGDNYSNAPTQCAGCHQANFNQALNPNHQKLSLSTDCATCHTTNSGWAPATFDVHDQYYPLTGAHKIIENECAQCHLGGNYEPMPNDCNACHSDNYAKTINPNHESLGISNDCASCHSTNPGWIPAKFTQHNQFYPLIGGHSTLLCKQCHQNGTFNNTPKDCNSCHNQTFQKAANPNHVAIGLSTDCATCHTQNPGWKPSTFNHNVYYPLTGAHASVAENCSACHKTGNIKDAPTDCNGCHNAAFTATKNPDHSQIGLSTDCATCHTTNPGWKPSTFNHNVYYPLTGAHASVAENCSACHKTGNIKDAPTDCNGCHNADFNAAQNPNHSQIGLSTDCATCHTTNPDWKPTTFNHNVYYPLTGAHASVAENCSACHKTGNVKDTPTDCKGCHNADFNATQNPNHTSNGFSTDCASCHTTNPNWEPAKFPQHDAFFPITGAHKSLTCIQCHKNGNYANTPNTCNGCHNAAFTATKNPNHSQLGLSTECATCHTTNAGWMPAKFLQHDAFFPITGAHTSLTCIQCHKNGNYSNTPNTCNGCHNAAFNAAQNPNHANNGFPTDCASCHTTNPGWRPSTFNHNNYYPLTGAHSSTSCVACHKNGVYKNTPTDCNACHNTAFNAAQNPNHASSGFSTDCASCHTTNPGWRPSTFNHNNYYPLTGAHASTSCVACHKNGVYKNTPTDCNACHNAAFNAAQNPNHASSGFSTDCASCHTTNPGWEPAKFLQHNAIFPITGAHTSLTCIQCHKNGNYSSTPNTCNGCHNAAFNAAQNPNHASSGFSTDCASCHTTNPGWRPSTFNHNNYYPLTGAHSSTSCVACHKNGVYKNTPADCNACHNAAFNAAQNPNHASGGFSTDCASCHTTNPGWRPSTFNHNNYYPLTGAHSSTSCVACHINGVYKNTPTDCNACHNAAFNAAVNPNHKTVGLSTDCASCHSTNPGWRPSSFKHTWPLQGAHAAIALNCTSCHNTGNASAAPTTCIGCHATDYNTATPNHASAGFPTNCTSCHSQNSWSPAAWNHDAQYFPIYSGKHKGEWTNCNECHTSAGNFNVFNCLNCHKKAETDKDHKDEKGYIYTSLACFSCHPDGSSDD